MTNAGNYKSKINFIYYYLIDMYDSAYPYK